MSSDAVSSTLATSPDDGNIGPDRALQVRKAIYSHDLLTAEDMNLVLGTARRAGPRPCPEWTALFSEALTDYVVHQNDPPDYIPQAKADWLAASLADNGGICSRAEFAMLIDVMTHALDVPTSLTAFALNEIKTAIVSGRRDAITGEDHPAGVVTRSDVEALRAVLYAAKTGTPGHVTRDEAEVLFEIAHAVTQTDPSFDELFARAVGNYLMALSLHAPEAAEALHFEKWLDEKDDFRGFWSRMFNHAPDENSLPAPVEAAETDLAGQVVSDEMLRNESEQIGDSNAAWVVAHLTHREELSPAELRLLQFLDEQALSIAAPLRELIDRANGAALSKSA